MNYKLIYEKLILKASLRTLNCYKESHHIVPKCMGGLDTKDNLVNLTPEEHYVAHQLLIKMYPNNIKLLYAANMMTVDAKYTQRNNKTFGWIKRKLDEAQKSKEFSEETRAKMSAAVAKKERIKCPHCNKTGLVGNMKRWHFDNCSKHPTNPVIHKLSEDHKLKISMGTDSSTWRKETCPHCNLTSKLCVIKAHVKFCKSNPNRIKKTEKTGVCLHCSKETTIGNLNRWHNNNCKNKP